MDTVVASHDQPVSNSTLRQFAALCVLVFGILFALSWHKHAGHPRPAAWIGLVFAIVAGVPGLFRPAFIRPVFLGISAVTEPVGHVISAILLGIIYFGVFTPLAVLFRLAGRDVLLRRRPSGSSYWIAKHQPSDPRRYLRTYQKQ